MKADLYIGNKPPASIELLAVPRRGDIVIFGGVTHTVNAIAHDADKRKLRLDCLPDVVISDPIAADDLPDISILTEDTDVDECA